MILKLRILRREALEVRGFGSFSLPPRTRKKSDTAKGESMDLGTFSVSLAVKDLKASKLFYEKFGFKAFAGDPSRNWVIMKNGDHAIGLFQGMFDKNILTFNPGWDAVTYESYRRLPMYASWQRQLKAQGVQLVNEALSRKVQRGRRASWRLIPTGTRSSSTQHV